MSVAKSLQEIQDLLNNANLSISEQQRLQREINRLKQISRDTTQERLDLEQDINNAIIVQSRYYNDLYKELQNITAELDNQLKAQNQMTKGLKGLTAEANKLANEEDNITTFNKKQLLAIDAKIKAEAKRAKQNALDLANKHKIMGLNDQDFATRLKHLQTLDKSQGGINKKEAEALVTARGMIKDNFSVINRTIAASKKRIGLENEFNKKLGAGGQIAQGLDKALQNAGLPALGISDAVDEAKKNFLALDDNARKSHGSFKIMKDVAGGIGQSLKGALTSANLMTFVFTALIKTVMDMDKSSGEFAKNNGISYKNALGIREEMSQIAMSSDDIMVSSKALMETQVSLNKFFGQSTKFTGQLAEDMTSIAKRTGLSEEAQGLFALESMKTGKGAKDILKTQTLTVRELNQQKGLQMSVKQIQEEIAKVSDAVFMTFEGSTEELTKQVMSVKALGANMQQVEAIASSMLDFESSIQAELEAELLLGKQINLEKARQAALQGDMGKVAEEVMKNDAIMNAFATDNVIQQEAAAKALGMSRNELAGMIKEQEKLEAVRAAGYESMDEAQKAYNALREEGLSKEQAAAELGDDNLAAQLESVSVGERMNALFERLQEILVPIGETILVIADAMMPIFEFVGKIAEGFKLIGDLATAFGEKVTELTSGLGILGSLLRGLAYIAVLLAGYFAYQAVGWIPVVGPVLGAIAAATVIGKGFSAISSQPKKAGDMLGTADGRVQVSPQEGGIFELSPNDDFAAAPGLADNIKDGKGEKGGGARRDAALIAEVRTLIDVSRQILAKNTTLMVDGEVLATTTTNRQVQDTRKTQ